MNHTKKRLSIIELAISITDIETIKLQMIQLSPLRSDNKIDDILSLLETNNYAHAQELIHEYIEETHETVIQRIPEPEETQEPNKEQAIINEYDFLSESGKDQENDIEENIESDTESKISLDNSKTEEIDKTEINHLELDTEVDSSSNDYTALLDIDTDDILAENIQINVSDDTKEIRPKEKTDFNLDVVPKDDFFNTNIITKDTLSKTETIKETIEEKIEIPQEKIEIPQENIKEIEISEEPINVDIPVIESITMEEVNENNEQNDIEKIQEPMVTQEPVTTKDTFYPAIVDIDTIFQDIQIKYPSVHQTEEYSDILNVWLEKISNEGYSEADVDDVLKHIEQLAVTNKAEAAQLLLATATTESKYAKFILARALYRGTLLKRDLDESFKIMSYLAFDKKYPEALCDLAQFYENGISIEKDKMQAELLYKEAMDLGVQRAQKHYERIQKESKGFFSFLKR